ncbi:chemoreceptor glutamine deamidase CheD [Sinorhizobium medicae]|uniref:Probable chemoreceptor glutamine deamidase CheD n=2 Tax=Sinorhizobium medicae TaxID=110321 RepID=CHED_SINMW|nr:chemoreceptor glutamine deamidase CheD [Sinorhizobium medicae]A6U619.1 RecName: Full=Probable chemoreceptor glutamine deamidase CheD [Sinorhizobium medicae WSM419]ABR59099.1 CheD [Sinorhizobium medicae WSM419]MBO1963615.1 chemoreceptor glutamine deamidase CheD [Sinorhizobium medicae]MDX0406120.1 chemoreceptor glutamine deamidase CheD [Sinorhizobium medicae]MDX0412888.1 chemoreceptor glutamine deamidase CheD [Sinorhizobium medicae]MDX0417859.1 chemoreceptor glutamine deamidase CheD [Sinorhi
MNTEAAGKRVHVIQGEFKVVNDPHIVLSTILGSCVAACLRDPVTGVGGMNHFLLPGSASSPSSGADATRYGVHLMELLINGLLKQGARRDRLEAKIFGGARTIARFSNVGEQNAAFARRFLMDEGIRIVGESTGGDHGRKLEYWPSSGRARQYALTGVEAQRAMQMDQRPAAPKPVESSIEFF